MNSIPEVFHSKVKKRRTAFITVVVVTAVLAALMVCVGVVRQNRPLPDPIRFRDFRYGSEQKNDTYVYVEIREEPFVFAEQTRDRVKYYYCLVVEGRDLYIVLLNIPDYNRAAQLEYTEPVVLTGVTRKITGELRDLAIDLFTESGWENVNADTLVNIVGAYYMDAAASPNDPAGFYGLAMILVLIGAITAFVYNMGYKQSKVTVASYSKHEWEQIAHEYSSGSYLYALDKNRVVFTSSYLISMQNYIDVMRYDQIAWVYRSVNKQNAVPISSSYMIIAKDSRVLTIGGLAPGGKKQQDAENGIFGIILDKNPAVLAGYADETRRQAKEMYGIDR
ncbi:MAG: hypothetical protein FWD45_06355 [Coriobacteriia bacterium]|nr:hypothetical protein [Coriobacteriia bacterium]